MRKQLILAAATVLSFNAIANFEGPGSELSLSTVEQALTLKDDTAVKLKGNLIKKLRSEDYIFSDGKNEIEVEIDAEVFNNQTFTPESAIIITGEVDSDWSNTTIDVEYLTLVK